MNQFFDFVNFISQKFLYLSINLIIKSMLLVAIIILLLKIFHRIPSRIKHLIWFIIIIIIAVLPVLNNVLFNFKLFHEKIIIINELKNGLVKVQNKISLEEINFKNERLKNNSTGTGKFDFKNKVHFSVMIFFMWMIIFVFLNIYFVSGYLNSYKIIKNSKPLKDKKIKIIIEGFKKKNNYKKDIYVYLNSGCVIPVTLYFFRNIILLPENAVRWDKKKMISALFHELTHIQRNDCIIHNISRFLCYFYWFNPFIWHAFKMLKLEQEHACDFDVVAKGVSPFDYAEILLNFSKNYSNSNDSLSPVSASLIRESCLESRIYNIIKLKPDYIKSYFRKPFIVLILIFFIIIFLTVFNPVNIAADNDIINSIIAKYKNFNGLVNLSNLPPAYKQIISDYPVIWPMIDYAKINDDEYKMLDKKLKDYYLNHTGTGTGSGGIDFSKERIRQGMFIIDKEKSFAIANADGIVKKIIFRKNRGYQITVKHFSGIESVYTGLDETDLNNVELNRKIRQGDVLGVPGHVKLNDNGIIHDIYCFHYSIEYHCNLINPEEYLNFLGNRIYYKTSKY